MIAFLSAAKRNKDNANHEQVATPDAANLFLAPNNKLIQNVSYWCDTGTLILLSRIINATSCEKMCPNSMPFLLKGHSQLWDCGDLDVTHFEKSLPQFVIKVYLEFRIKLRSVLLDFQSFTEKRVFECAFAHPKILFLSFG